MISTSRSSQGRRYLAGPLVLHNETRDACIDQRLAMPKSQEEFGVLVCEKLKTAKTCSQVLLRPHQPAADKRLVTESSPGGSNPVHPNSRATTSCTADLLRCPLSPQTKSSRLETPKGAKISLPRHTPRLNAKRSPYLPRAILSLLACVEPEDKERLWTLQKQHCTADKAWVGLRVHGGRAHRCSGFRNLFARIPPMP